MLLHDDRLFLRPGRGGIARRLYATIRDLPIISPHGHTDPRWFAEDQPFADPATLLVKPDHYIFRMLYSQGVPLEKTRHPAQGRNEGRERPARDLEALRQPLASVRGTPSRLWFEHALSSVFGINERLSSDNADRLYDRIAEKLQEPDYRPRALFERFKIEAISTTEGALDDLKWHDMIRASGWGGKVVTAYRPDSVLDPEFEGFAANLEQFGALTGEDVMSWSGYLAAHRQRRDYFRERGATSSDHGHATARTANLSKADAEALFAKVVAGKVSAEEADLFRGQMLTEWRR